MIDQIKLGFVEREATPRLLMRLGIQLLLVDISLSNTFFSLYIFGIKCARSTVHNWVHKADLQPVDGESPDHVAVDQKAIRINDEQYYLYAGVGPQTNRILHLRLFPTYTIPIAREFLTELAEKHDVEDALFLVDDADDLIGGLRRENYTYRVEQHVFRILPNVSLEKYNSEPFCFQTVLAITTHRPRQRGYKPHRLVESYLI